jgi:hypothetical protein
MATVTEIGTRLGIASTCAALALPRATHYRWRRPLSHRHARSHPARSATRNAPRSSACCTSRALWTWLPRKSMRRCSTRGGTSAPSARCIASSRPTRRCGSGGINSGIPATRLRSFWPAGPTSWTAPAAGVPRPSRDQSTQGAGTLAGLIAYPATPTCQQGHLCVACGRSRRGHACHQQGEADAAACEGCKAREG